MHPLLDSSKLFRENLLKNLGFTVCKQDYYTLYQNSNHLEHGYFFYYEREGYYSLSIADYTIPYSFSTSFDISEHLIRFGTVYQGTTNFKLQDKPVSSFRPSSFLIVEKNSTGIQTWLADQHLHGIEFVIHPSYLENVLKNQLHTPFNINHFIENFTYYYLPLEVISILKQLQALLHQNSLNPLFIDGYLLQCLAQIVQIIEGSKNNAFSKQLNYGKVKIGKNKYLHLSSEDISALQKAHAILLDHIDAPPTIEHLSQLVFLHPQKLKAGFSHYYHIPIGQFIISTRMAIAANLLCTTDESISEIGKKVGYHYSSNFIKTFRKMYCCTPLEYRHQGKI